MLRERHTRELTRTVGATFPTVRGRDLTFDTKWMPQDFEGARNLVVLAFRMHHQADVASWLRYADSWEAQDEGFRFYEVPVIQYMFPLYHDFIDQGMANTIRDEATLRRTYTLYTNVDTFVRRLGLSTTDQITTLLVDGDGHILAATVGPFTQLKGEVHWQAAKAQMNAQRTYAAQQAAD